MTTFTVRRPRISSRIAVGFVAMLMGLFIGALVPHGPSYAIAV